LRFFPVSARWNCYPQPYGGKTCGLMPLERTALRALTIRRNRHRRTIASRPFRANRRRSASSAEWIDKVCKGGPSGAYACTSSLAPAVPFFFPITKPLRCSSIMYAPADPESRQSFTEAARSHARAAFFMGLDPRPANRERHLATTRVKESI
jgi:hypothetical protein